MLTTEAVVWKAVAELEKDHYTREEIGLALTKVGTEMMESQHNPERHY